jgi:iron complex outermembrane recepter protein
MLASTTLKKALFSGTAFVGMVCALPGTALAQVTDPETTTQPASQPSGAETPDEGAEVTDTTADEGQSIVVTGSRIRRDPNDSPLPLQIITTQEIERNGITNPEQLIGYLTTNGTGADNLSSNADVVSGQQRGNNGASFANLRSQGSGATLVLLNGRRVAAHGLQGSAVDVNQIPFSAIERVEVLKEGASAIYGTDAIGGVINFILRKDYEGIGLSAFVDATEEGDHTIYRTSAIAGYGDLDSDGFNVMGAISYSDIPELRGDQRDFVNTFQPNRGLSPDTRGTPFATIFPLAPTGPNTPGGLLIQAGAAPGNPRPAPFLPGSTTVRAEGGINVLDLPGREGCGVIDGQGPYDEQLWATPSAAFACAWDTGRAAVLQQPLETLTWLGRGVLRLGDHEISLEATGSDATAIKRFSNVQITPNTTTQNYAAEAGDPGYELVYQRLIAAFPELAARGRLPVTYRWRCIECGRREIATDTQTARYTLGVDGPLFSGWDYRAGASYAESQSQSTLGSGYYFRGTLANGQPDPNVPLVPGTTNQRGLIGALNSGLVNVFLLPGQTQSAAGLAAIQSASAAGVVLYGGKYSVTQVDASVSGPLFELPGGTVRAAFGVDYRKEKYNFNGDAREAQNRPVIIAAPFDDQNALSGVSREIKAAYAEVLVPIIEGLEVTGAVRFDDYGDFGTTTNPLVNFKFRPVPWVMFRGNYNTAFRVPAFNQLFNGVTESLYTGTDLADPQTCPGGVPNPSKPGCENLQRSINILNGGNLDLQAETAEMYSLGVVFEPSRNFSASVDYFSIDRSGTIGLFTLRQLVNNFALFPEPFIRDSAGRLIAIDQRFQNAGGSLTEGVEIVVRGGLDVGAGRFNAGVDGTLLLTKEEQVFPGGPIEDRLGVFSFSGDLGLRWKHNAFVGYTADDWNFTLTQIYRDGYDNQQLPGIANGTVTRPDVVEEVEPYIIYNAQVTFSGIEGMRFGFGVKNLFDTDPPFAISYDSFTGGGSSWEPRVADPRGRSYTFLVEVKF